ncbi:hypothetical protein [Taylorella equigenitalis]|uniref:hypothetical protein n=1 Tax=Taylorella equigenitalis TaxID=29575 RepID=UPI0005D2C1C9|nr:hypothetical protein [Taylorella equigenitalis]
MGSIPKSLKISLLPESPVSVYPSFFSASTLSFTNLTFAASLSAEFSSAGLRFDIFLPPASMPSFLTDGPSLTANPVSSKTVKRGKKSHI